MCRDSVINSSIAAVTLSVWSCYPSVSSEPISCFFVTVQPTTTEIQISQMFYCFPLLNIHLFSYNHWDGIKSSRCIRKKTATVWNFLLLREAQGAITPPPPVLVWMRAARQQLNTMSNNKYIHCYKKVPRFLTAFTEMFRSNNLCRNRKQITFKQCGSPPDFIFKFQPCYWGLENIRPHSAFGSESWRHWVCILLVLASWVALVKHFQTVQMQIVILIILQGKADVFISKTTHPFLGKSVKPVL